MTWRPVNTRLDLSFKLQYNPLTGQHAIILLLLFIFPLYLFECFCIWKSLTDLNVGASKNSHFCWNNIFEVFTASLNLMILLEIWKRLRWARWKAGRSSYFVTWKSKQLKTRSKLAVIRQNGHFAHLKIRTHVHQKSTWYIKCNTHSIWKRFIYYRSCFCNENVLCCFSV